MLSICLGLRVSEIRGLRWSDIDGEYITIHSAIVQGENGPIEKGPKTTSGFRRVHIPKPVQELLATAPHTSDHLTELTGHAIYCGFSRICEKAGVPHYRFHDLRHSCASLLLANDVPLKQIQEWLGHSDIGTTANIYSHLDYKSKITSANVMDNILTLPDTGQTGWHT